MQINVAMRTVDLFPDMVTQMVMIGEESGAIDDMLSKVAAIFEQEVDDMVDGLTSLLEPIIMVVLGAGRRHGRGHVPPHFQAGLCDTLTPSTEGRAVHFPRPSVIPVPDTSD
jgi:hypothetical protein